METAGYGRKSRRKMQKDRKRKEKKTVHFQTVRFGGFEETQMICYLWDLVKSVEAVGAGTGTETLEDVEKRMRRQIRVEMRRYFVRQKHRNRMLVLRMVMTVFCVVCLFGFLIGIDQVAGDSMYPYLNHGDWIVYSRVGRAIQRDDVVVFEKNGEYLVKRIAGLPGDTVEISSSGGRVVVNGEMVREDEQMRTVDAKEREEQDRFGQRGMPMTVLDGQYLVLGDNRGISIDSRDSGMGTVPETAILGRVVLVVRLHGR